MPDNINCFDPACYGQAWVKDGKVIVKNPSEGGVSATVTPCEGVNLYVSGVKVLEKTPVTAQDEVVLEPERHEEPGKLSARISPDGMAAYLDLTASVVTRYTVDDREPETDLVLTVSPVTEKRCPLDMVELNKSLADNKILYGVKNEVIQGILEDPQDGSYLIAEGDPPGETTNDQVDIIFEKEVKGVIDKSSAAKINLLEMHEILSVKEGALLAIRRPGIQGFRGRNVSGDLIIPPKPAVLELGAAKGAKLSPDGNSALAAHQGRPTAKKLGQAWYIGVDPVLKISGNVDISTGNIRFKGDVVVHGNVQEGMTVQASGKITIKGMVYGAKIGAQGDVTVEQYITGSSVVAGGNIRVYGQLKKFFESLSYGFEGIIASFAVLMQHPQMKNVHPGQIVQHLIDKKFTWIPGQITELIKFTQQNEFILPVEVTGLVEKIYSNFSGLNLLKLGSTEILTQITEEIREALGQLDALSHSKSGISLSYAVNSSIEAAGNVAVNGRGCINTVIRAGGTVNVKGVFRGGRIIAGGDVLITEAGSDMGAPTLVRTTEGKHILIKKANEGVKLQIGAGQFDVTALKMGLRAELDGSIIIIN